MGEVTVSDAALWAEHVFDRVTNRDSKSYESYRTVYRRWLGRMHSDPIYSFRSSGEDIPEPTGDAYRFNKRESFCWGCFYESPGDWYFPKRECMTPEAHSEVTEHTNAFQWMEKRRESCPE